jgi:hypothetical protein
MKYVGLTALVLFLVLVIYVATRKSVSIEEELAKLSPGDRQALQSMLGEAGLAVAKLRAVGPNAIKYNPQSVAMQDGRVVGLRLSDLPLGKAEAIAGLTGLRELWLTGNGLRSARGLSALPELRKLNLSHNALTQVSELRDLPALTDLDLSDNQLTDLAPLTALPALQNLDVTKNQLKALPSPLPGRWNVKSDVGGASGPGNDQAKDPAMPKNWVQDTPSTKSQNNKVSLTGFVSSKSYQVSGTVSSLHGAMSIFNISGTADAGGAWSTLELTAEKGRVRGYLEYVPEGGGFIKVSRGWIYAEAEPGKPGTVKGTLHLNSGGHGDQKVYTLILESVGEQDASGITFRVSR